MACAIAHVPKLHCYDLGNDIKILHDNLGAVWSPGEQLRMIYLVFGMVHLV